MPTPTLDELIGQLPPDAGPAILALLRRISHDLNGPLSTLGLEAYTAENKLRGMERAVQEHDAQATRRCVDTLGDLHDNVKLTIEAIFAYVRRLETLSASLEGGKDQPTT